MKKWKKAKLHGNTLSSMRHFKAALLAAPSGNGIVFPAPSTAPQQSICVSSVTRSYVDILDTDAVGAEMLHLKGLSVAHRVCLVKDQTPAWISWCDSVDFVSVGVHVPKILGGAAFGLFVADVELDPGTNSCHSRVCAPVNLQREPFNLTYG